MMFYAISQVLDLGNNKKIGFLFRNCMEKFLILGFEKEAEKILFSALKIIGLQIKFTEELLVFPLMAYCTTAAAAYYATLANSKRGSFFTKGE